MADSETTHVSRLKKWSINKIHKSYKDDPVIISFASNGQLQPQFGGDVKFKKYVDSKNSQPNLVHAQTSNSDYVGSQNVGDIKYEKYCVGVLNKKTGKMTIYASDFYNLQPHGLNLVDPNDELFQSNEETSYMDKADRLTETFGSKRRKSQMEARKRNEIETEEMEFLIKKTAAETKTSDIRDNIVSEETIINVNWDACKASDAYDLNQIITEDEFTAMDENVKEFREATDEQIKKWKKEKKYCPFITKHFKKIAGSEKRTKMLLYLSYMIELYKLRAHEIRKKEPLPNTIPEMIRMKLLNLFTQSSIAPNGRPFRSAPSPLKDKLVAFIVVLALMINGFQMNLEELPDIKIPVTRFVTLLRSIGITADSGLKSKIISVKTPLRKMADNRIRKKK